VTDFEGVLRWISGNEALLSGIAALAAIVGLIISPIGAALRRRAARRRKRPVAAQGSEPRTALAAPRTEARPQRVVAVLPFDNLSSDPELQYFSDGISEEIIRRLSRGANLAVIGRASSFQFRAERKGEAARSLGCSHVLDGSVRRAAGRVRIAAHLVETAGTTTVWSDRYDRELADVFAVQDDIAGNIAAALDGAFRGAATRTIDTEAYDLYLRASPRSFGPEELRSGISQLEDATKRAPDFADAWGRLAYLRSWLRYYEPYADRAASAARVQDAAGRALATDPRNFDALVARLFVLPPFGRFIETEAALRLVQQVGGEDGQYTGWFLRNLGHVRESAVEDERAYRSDPLNPMSANLVALSRMAAGRVEEAIPLFEDVMARIPDMSFPFANLLRARALLGDWQGVDRLLALQATRPLREFREGLDFIRTKRDPTPANLERWRGEFEARARTTGCVDVSRLVYTAHLGLADAAYAAALSARLGPRGADDDLMGPDAYRTALLFQAGMPELRNDPRFPRLCARLGLVEYWTTTGRWPDCADAVPYDFRAECARVRDVPVEAFGF
jgi:TolB-like protein/tetratricopeptide (TPR) repeat protein